MRIDNRLFVPFATSAALMVFTKASGWALGFSAEASSLFAVLAGAVGTLVGTAVMAVMFTDGPYLGHTTIWPKRKQE